VHAVSAAAQPCRRFGARNAATACLTSSLVVMPRWLARPCRRCARLAGILSVMVTDFSIGNRDEASPPPTDPTPRERDTCLAKLTGRRPEIALQRLRDPRD